MTACVCPCGGADFARCCGRFLDGGQIPGSAEQLMRSRYCAYVRGNAAYIADTWHARTRPATALSASQGERWLGLHVRSSNTVATEATVEFVARYKINGRAHRLHEVSRFVLEQGRWWYVDGSYPESKSTT